MMTGNYSLGHGVKMSSQTDMITIRKGTNRRKQGPEHNFSNSSRSMSSNFQDSLPAFGTETVHMALSWMCVEIKDAYLQGGELGPINEKLLCSQLTLYHKLPLAVLKKPFLSCNISQLGKKLKQFCLTDSDRFI